SPHQTSRLCAAPSSCSRVYASSISGSTQVPSARCSPHAAITRRKQRFQLNRKRPRRSVRRRLRLTCSARGVSSARGSGLHHSGGTPSEYHGKMPREYASSSRAGSRSPPTATSPSRSNSEGSGNHGSLSGPSQAGTCFRRRTSPLLEPAERRVLFLAVRELEDLDVAVVALPEVDAQPERCAQAPGVLAAELFDLEPRIRVALGAEQQHGLDGALDAPAVLAVERAVE